MVKQDSASMNLVVFGTSLLWGQGLEDQDKIHTVLARLIEARNPGCKANVTFLAHSGASTGFNPDNSVDTLHKPRIHGEVPTLYPTIVQEMEEFDALNIPPETIDLVVLDAGSNDVHVTKILDPLTSPREISKSTEIYCHQHMPLLIERLLDKFKNARIVIVGYYEFITEESEEGYIHTMLTAFGKVPGGFIADFVLEAFEGLFKRRLLKNCDVFAGESLAAFKEIAADFNGRVPGKRVLVVDPPIKTENAAFASDPWLWGINDDLSAVDPVAKERAAACECAGISRTQPLFCSRASAGHPNPKGAKAYAEAILALL